MNNKYLSPRCKPLSIDGKYYLTDLSATPVSDKFTQQAKNAPQGEQLFWGMPFHIDRVHLIYDHSVQFGFSEIKTRWLCFLHTDSAEEIPLLKNTFYGMADIARHGTGLLNKLAVTYFILYSDGSEEKYEIRNRHQINTGNPLWGENCFQAVPHQSPFVYAHESPAAWGIKQQVHVNPDRVPSEETYINWICAWKNPYPKKSIVGIRLEPSPENERKSCVVLSGLTACDTDETPIRWKSRQKFLLCLPRGIEIDKNRRTT